MGNQSVHSLLKNVPLFKELVDEELQSIVNITMSRTYRQRQLVFMQGDPLDRVFFIHSGKVKIYKSDVSGKEQIVTILQAGDMFPHAGFFRKGDYPAHAEITEDATLMFIPITAFEELLIRHPEVSIKLFRVMGEKIIDLQNRLEEQILHNTYEQIIMLLLRLSDPYGVEIHGGKQQLTTQFTNRELANMIGSSRETVSRTLTQLKKNKLIETDEGGYFILDKDALEDELF